MKRFAFVLLAPLAGCLEFDALLDAGCARDASWAECRVVDDAGVDDGGADAGDPSLDGGFCSSSGWCWENPALPGAVDLFAVWGTSDTDVWAAGSGGAVLRFNGTRWWKVDVFAPDASIAQLEPAVRAVAVDDAGVAWLAGEQMQLTGLSPQGVRRVGAVSNRIAAATFGGTTWFLPAGTAPSLERLVLGQAQPTTLNLSVSGADNVLALTANERGAFVAYDRVSPAGAEVFSTVSMTATPLSTPAATRVEIPRNFARRGTTDVLVCANGDAFESSGAGWTWVGQAPLVQGVRAHAIDALPDGGSRWWFAGGAGAIASTEAPLDAGLLVYGSGGETLHAGWLSPSGHYWAVGSAGVVLETSVGGGRVERGARLDYPLVDLAVSGSTAVAVGRGGVSLTRIASGEWTRTEDPSNLDLRAVALGPLGTCTLDLLGEVFCTEVGVWQSGARLGDGGVIPFEEQSRGAIAQRVDGGAVMALGTTVATYSGGAWAVLDAGLTRDDLSELVLTPDGLAVAVNDESNGALVIFDGVSRRVCAATSALLGVARTASGFLVVGPNLVGECSATGTFSAVSTPVQRAWVSAWVDPQGGWWILDDSGFLLRRPVGGAWQRERLPLGESGLDGPETTRIVGDDDELFIIGKSGTVLRRRFP